MLGWIQYAQVQASGPMKVKSVSSLTSERPYTRQDMVALYRLGYKKSCFSFLCQVNLTVSGHLVQTCNKLLMPLRSSHGASTNCLPSKDFSA